MTLAIKMSLSKFVLDKGGFTKALDAAIKTQMRQAAREFFRVVSATVPVRSGFAQGALSNILEALGGGSAGKSTPAQSYLSALRGIRRQTFTSGRKNRKVKTTEPVEEYYYFGGRKVKKIPENAKNFATRSENIFQVVGEKYTFNFAVSITYFNLNDLFRVKTVVSSPWESFAKGRIAAVNYLRNEGIARLPKVTDYVLKEKSG